MGNKMLIDASHPEETRVVVVKGSRVEEFDFESQSRKQLRGSIFLAKVIRVEPSLQAAFVDYGGNRHGFLAFAEIHPDYYRLPQADIEATKHEGAHEPRGQKSGRRHRNDAHEADEAGAPVPQQPGHAAGSDEPAPQTAAADDQPVLAADAAPTENVTLSEPDQAGFVLPEPAAAQHDDGGSDNVSPADDGGDADGAPRSLAAAVSDNRRVSEIVVADEAAASTENDEDHHDHEHAGAGEHDGEDMPMRDASAARRGDDEEDDEEDEDGLSAEEIREQQVVESLGGEDALEELPQRERPRRRLYKIQEVIKRNQILLVQVVKEERGNKGAALTTFLSLAGRYTVLMPNTASGGGISRKITTTTDRKRLREIATELDVPQGMGLIVRTAGASRTKAEIKRDFEYLLRLWENVRDLTLKSKAPALVYEEGDLIKRSIRDLYNREIDEIQVSGDNAFREAKDFMRMLMPSHAKNVLHYAEPEPLFTRHGVEHQLNMMFNPRVTLRSGGYIVINQTEALVAVDVNSGKSTREHSIEETALKTNLEAAEEVSRQLRLRDLAGLIVIDFIDMEERRNNRSVERKLKDCLRNDRARIQVGRISPFGLLEMSRQRLRTGMVEGSTRPCHVCEGTGVIRSTESVALLVLRAIEDWLISKGPANLAACTSMDAALYILNNKRVYLRDVEDRYGVTLTITSSETMHGSAYTIEKLAPASGRVIEVPKSVQMTWVHYDDDAVVEDEEETEVKADAGADAASADSGEQTGEQREQRNRRRRKRFRNGHDRGEERPAHEAQPAGERPAGDEHVHAWRTRADVPQPDISEPGESLGGVQPAGEGTAEEEARRSRRSRRRGRRGGQRQRELRSEAGTMPVEMRQGAGEQPEAGMPEGAAPAAWQVETESRAESMAMGDAVSAVAELEPRREQEERLPAPIAVEAPQAEMAVAIALPAQAEDVQALEAAKAQADEAARAQEAANAEEAARRRAEQEQARAEARKARPSRGGWWQRRLGG